MLTKLERKREMAIRALYAEPPEDYGGHKYPTRLRWQARKISRRSVETTKMAELKKLGQQSETSPAMTVREAAQYLKSARAHVFRLIHSGILPFQKMGKRFVVPREAVEQLLSRGWIQNGKWKTGKSARR